MGLYCTRSPSTTLPPPLALRDALPPARCPRRPLPSVQPFLFCFAPSPGPSPPPIPSSAGAAPAARGEVTWELSWHFMHLACIGAPSSVVVSSGCRLFRRGLELK